MTANYKLSFDILRRELRGHAAWVLVLDTKGINVWCAAGKGTFGTDELVRRITEARLSEVVAHRRVIVPQLGAVGVRAGDVQKCTGFRVSFGPVEARDIPAYIAAGYKKTAAMSTIRFPLLDRLVLTPMELNPAMKKFPWFAAIRQSRTSAGRVSMGVAHDPPSLRQSVLLLRLQLRDLLVLAL